MAGRSGEAMEVEEVEDIMLWYFEDIYNDVKKGIARIHSLELENKAQSNNFHALQLSATTLSSENERLTKLYTGSLNKLADQLGAHTKCQSLEKELERVKEDHISKETEYMNSIKLMKQDSEQKIKDFESQIGNFLIQKAADQATIKQLQGDIIAHKNHLESVTIRLKRVRYDDESRYQHEIQDLKDCLSIEQEEKNELNKKILNLEKELLISRNKAAELQRDLTSNYHVETLKQKIMKLRKENEVLKRNLHDSKEG